MKKEREKMKKLLSSSIALTMVLTAFAAITFESTPATAIEEEVGIEVPTLRVYGRFNEGAGDIQGSDPLTDQRVEDLPYTDAIAPFDPQHPQAPVKDSITFNPVYLSETISDDELLGDEGLQHPSGPYDDRIKAGFTGSDAEEKVYLRQWYEPWHWDKDVDADCSMVAGDGNDLEDFWDDVITPLQWLRDLPTYALQGKVPIEFESPIVSFNETVPFLDPDDEIYAAIMQEFTYLLVEPQYHQPTYGKPGVTDFVFPVGMQEEDVWDPYGYGLTSLDYDFDGHPDIVKVHSEKSLFAETKIAADFDGGQTIDPIDPDGYELTGDEMVILTTEVGDKAFYPGDRLQFLDHMIEIVKTYANPPSVLLSVYYTGDLEPEWLGYQLVGQKDMALFGRKLPATYIKAVENGGGGTNLCDFPTGPWFVWISAVHYESPSTYVYLMLGRALGHADTAMENGSYAHDLTHKDPWWLKRFYVDGHEYNVVAIETYRRTFESLYNETDSWDWTNTEWRKWASEYTFPNGEPKPAYMVNDLDSAWAMEIGQVNNNLIEEIPYDYNWTGHYIDESCFKYITIRTPIPKSGQRQNPVTHEIEYAYRDSDYSVQGDDAETVRDWGYYHLIEQHSVRLQPYFAYDYLSIMPPYNYEHTIAKDVETNWSALRNEPATEIPYYDAELPWGTRQWYDQPWDPVYDPDDGWDVPPQWIGDILTRRPPITQDAGDYTTFDQRVVATEQMMYVDEDINPQYKGELKEVYYDHGTDTVAASGDGEEPDEVWFVSQFHTLPDEYTEFVLPEGNEQYLLTSAFYSENDVKFNEGGISEYQRAGSYGRILNQEKRSDDIYDIIWIPYGNRVKFWFNPMNVEEQITLGDIADASDLKIYKCEDGIRIYGLDSEGAGDYYVYWNNIDMRWEGVVDPLNHMVVEVKPYTDPLAPFDPRSEQAPHKDFITFDPAYMDEYQNGGEPLSELYKWIAIEEADAREKVFHRMWYEPWHWAKDVDADNDKLGDDVPDYDQDGLRETWELIWFLKHYPEYQDLFGWTIEQLKNPSQNPYGLRILDTNDEIYPALMQEFTYMYVDVWDFPTHGQPGTSSIAFPIATEFDQLGSWNPATGDFHSDGGYGDFGYGLTTFDANFDGIEDICRVHSEYSLALSTGIRFDSNGDGVIQQLDKDMTPLNGTEIVIFAVENLNLSINDFAMFLDHMVQVKDITSSEVTFTAWRTGGSTGPTIYPSKISKAVTLSPGEMYVLRHGSVVKRIPKNGGNVGYADGPWFIYLRAMDNEHDRIVVDIGRALGCTFTAMEQPGGGPDTTPGDPWYMKRFYVDGHEYSTVAIYNHYEEYAHPYKDEEWEFKYITMRTSIPKIPVIIEQHSQYLQDYNVCDDISVMPPFNYEHTARRDIVSGWTETQWWKMAYFEDLHGWYSDALFENEDDGLEDYEDFIDLEVVGEIIKNKPPLVVHINEEDREPQFKGELEEKYNKRPKVNLTADTGGIVSINRDGEIILSVSGMIGTLEGRTVEGGMDLNITRTNSPANGDGEVYGSWYLYDPGIDDSPPLFFDADWYDLFYEDTIVGDIRGTYDHSAHSLILELTCHYAPLASYWNDVDWTYLVEWFLCFYAEFDVDVTLTLNTGDVHAYMSSDFPPTIYGGWDPADQYPNVTAGEDYEVWMIEQWHTVPDQYTELGLPDDGQLYLLTSSWKSEESIIRDTWLEYPYGFALSDDYYVDWCEHDNERVTFWYDPGDCEDIYVNTAWVYGEEPGEFDPWDYDTMSPFGEITYPEVINAVNDYFALLISYDELIQVITLYFS